MFFTGSNKPYYITLEFTNYGAQNGAIATIKQEGQPDQEVSVPANGMVIKGFTAMSSSPPPPLRISALDAELFEIILIRGQLEEEVVQMVEGSSGDEKRVIQIGSCKS